MLSQHANNNVFKACKMATNEFYEQFDYLYFAIEIITRQRVVNYPLGQRTHGRQ